MIKFFRKIRQNLLSEGNTGKYLKYAIGEIILVVIGILIALQINNWNEGRKFQIKGQGYLSSIQTDLLQDLKEIERMSVWKERLECFNKALPNFRLTDDLANLKLDDTNCEITYRTMFNPQRSFRSNTSSFDAMISEGSSNLIANKPLFAKIQRLYVIWNPGLRDIINIQRAESSRLKYKWAHLVALKPNTNITQVKDSALIADLIVFFENKRTYFSSVSFVEKLIGEILSEIDTELNK